MILDELEFDDLLSAAQVNEVFSELAARIFMRKYSKFQFFITNNFELPPENDPLTTHEPKKGTVAKTLKWLGFVRKTEQDTRQRTHVKVGESFKFLDYDTMLNTFMRFGRGIFRVKVNYLHFQNAQIEFVSELITKYSANSLIEMEFDYCSVHNLEFIKAPLVNVKTVRFVDHLKDYENGTYRMNDLFPAIQRLYLNNYYTNICNFDSRMPNLEHILITQQLHEYPHNSFENFEKVLQKNSHIRSIELVFYPRIPLNYLQSVLSTLPNLDNLTLPEIQWGTKKGDEIYFQNVTTLSLICKQKQCRLGNLHFPKLQRLHVELTGPKVEELLIFLNKHNQLAKLYLQYDNLNNDFKVKTIRKLLNIHEKLVQLHFIMKSDRNMVRMHLANVDDCVWNITNAHKGLLFERKKHLIYD